MKQLVIIAAFLALLWWLKQRAAAPRAGAPSIPTGLPGPPGAPKAPAPRRAPAPADVAIGISDGELDILRKNGDAADGSGSRGGWMDNFYRQLWLPASLIPLSSLTKEDMTYAMQFLQNAGGEFTRRDDLGQRGAALLNDTQGGAEVFTQIVSTVASIIPVIGTLIAKVNAIQTGELQAGDAWNTAMGNGAIGSLMRSSVDQDTAQTRHLLANYNDNNMSGADGPDAPLDRFAMLLPEAVHLEPMQNFSPPMTTFVTTDGHTFHMRARLFTRYAGGWILPWLSWHTNGDTEHALGMRATVNSRARIFRAVDAIVAASQPWTREGGVYWAEAKKDAVYQTEPRGADHALFFYVNPFFGPMLGSIFPPTFEDQRYVGSDQRTYSYYGEPMTGLPKGAQGPDDDSKLDIHGRIVGAPKVALSGPLTITPSLPPPVNPAQTYGGGFNFNTPLVLTPEQIRLQQQQSQGGEFDVIADDDEPQAMTSTPNADGGKTVDGGGPPLDQPAPPEGTLVPFRMHAGMPIERRRRRREFLLLIALALCLALLLRERA